MASLYFWGILFLDFLYMQVNHPLAFFYQDFNVRYWFACSTLESILTWISVSSLAVRACREIKHLNMSGVRFFCLKLSHSLLNVSAYVIKSAFSFYIIFQHPIRVLTREVFISEHVRQHFDYFFTTKFLWAFLYFYVYEMTVTFKL